MDILASLVPSTAAPVVASVPADAAVAPSESFASLLSQVSAPVADPSPPVLPALAPVLPSVAVAPADPAPATVGVEVPAPPIVQTLPVVEPPTTSTEDVLNLSADEPVAQADTPKPTTQGDSTLDDIRQRMALIESAGQLDAASVIVLPPIPVSVPLPSPASVETAAPAQAVSTLQAPSVTVADDDLDTPSDPVDVPDAMPALVASVAESVPGVHAQTDDPQPDSQPDPQAVFSLAPAPFRVATETVTSNNLVLAAAIGSTEWAADLGQQMVDMVTRGDQQVDLRLHPAELGPLSISLNLNDGTTQAQFQAAHASVRAALEQALPQLREALATQGIALGQASVSDQPSRQAAGGQAQRDPQSNPARTPLSSSEVAAAPVQQLQLRTSGVDLYV